MPRFSVVITTYDRPALLAEAVASVVAQTVDDWECIVVDDAGTIPAGPFDDPRVRVVRLPRNSGGGAALNAGAAEAAGDAIAILDDDDVWLPHRLELAERGLARAPLTLCWSRYMDEAGPVRGRVLDGECSDVVLDSTTPNPGATAVLREAWAPMREDVRTHFDTEWWLHQAQRWPVATVPEVGHLVRRHAGARHGGGSAVRFRDNARMIADNRGWFDAHPRAEAFRLRRGAWYASRTGDRRAALALLARSLRLAPSSRTALQMARAAAGRPRPEAPVAPSGRPTA